MWLLLGFWLLSSYILMNGAVELRMLLNCRTLSYAG